MGSILQYTHCYQGSAGRGGLWCPYRLPDHSNAMGEIAEELRAAGQSDSEGSNSSLDVGNGFAGMALSAGEGSPDVGTAIKCRWVGCGHWFGHLELLASHVTQVHATSGQGGLFYCGWEGCSRGDRGFNARYKMLVHVRTHTNEKPHHCFKCDKSFSRAENLKIHARSHTGERPYICPIPGCGKAYSNSSDRFKHTRTHSVDKPYVCKVPGCPKRYTDPSSLRKHVKTYRHFSHEGAPSDNDEVVCRPGNNQIKLSCEDEVLHCGDKRTTSASPVNISVVNVPKLLKRDSGDVLKRGCEDQEAKICANEECCSSRVDTRSPLPCSKSCCVGSERDSVPPHAGSHLLWKGHDVHYNLFHSWITADLAVLSQSLPWASGLSLWNHPLLQPPTCGQRMTGAINHSPVSNSGLGIDVTKYSQLDVPPEVTEYQDKPLDLTMNHTGARV
ncbi:zinc finger protein 717 isoform X1 [Cryptotermes secundus]|uniref:zinc finger protein 717 isoform X1 n=1 Tax=Cryptotermes secundus TaxID=105785 RepID=UPI000CD7D5B7|nr:zinc finger protein 717 isoform X1 [Cryptotermes secundus]